MAKTLTFALAFAALALAAVGLWCWYNKDRYQFVHYQRDSLGNITSLVFDKNTGEVVK